MPWQKQEKADTEQLGRDLLCLGKKSFFMLNLVTVDDIFLTDVENVVNDIELSVEIPDDPVGQLAGRGSPAPG